MSIGKDIIGTQVKGAKLDLLPTNSRNRRAVFELLLKSDKPVVSVSEVARALHLPWYMAKGALVELLLTGKVEFWRSGRTLLFRIKTVAKEVQK